MTPGLCSVCGDTPDWCPEAKGTLTPAPPTSVGEWRGDVSTAVKPEDVESPATLGQDVVPNNKIIWCSYCDGPGGFVSNSGHSTACFRYVKPKRGRR